MALTYRKKNWHKKRNWKKKKMTIARPRFGKRTLPTRNKVYSFTREVEQLVDLTTPFPALSQPFDLVATADLGVAGNCQFRLIDLPNHSEFTNGLFKQYRINAVKMTIYCSANMSDLRNQTGILCQTAYNRDGAAIGVGNTREDWNQVQSKRRFTLYKYKQLYFKCNQLAHISQNLSTVTGYGLIKPKWVSVDEPDIDHYGINLRFDSITGADLTATDAFPKLRIIYKYYLQCRGVK